MTPPLAWLAALALVASGCDGPAPPAPAPIAPPPAPAASQVTPVPDAPRALELPDGACKIAAPGFRGDGLALRLAPGGPAYATVGRRGLFGLLGAADDRHSAELVIPVGPATGFGLRVETEHLVLRGFVDLAAIELRPVRPVVLDGFLVPARLRVTAAAPDDLSVVPQLPAAVELSGPAPVQRLACADVSLGPAEPDLDAALPPARKPDQRAELRRGDHDLSVEPGAAPVARLHADAPSLVRVLDTRGRSTRIAWSLGQVTVFGWLPSAALARPSAGRRAGDEGRMVALPAHDEPLATLVCRDDVPLVVDLAGERTTVGHVRPGAVIAVLERTPTHARIATPRAPDGLFGPSYPDVAPVDGAALWVPAPALERCAPATP